MFESIVWASDGSERAEEVLPFVEGSAKRGGARADRIVAGTRGHTAIGELRVGSVTDCLVQIAPCLVLVVPPDTRAS
jgi:nucleotide-binding universal stress UspA family protein